MVELRFFRKIYSGVMFTRSISEASKGNFSLSLKLLDKSEKGKKNIIYSHLLLRGYLMFYFDDYIKCIDCMEEGKIKIKSKNGFNSHEKKYLTLYADDLINASITHGNIDKPLVKIDNDFDLKCVESRLKEYFPLADGSMDR